MKFGVKLKNIIKRRNRMKPNNKNKLWTQENYDMLIDIWSRGEEEMNVVVHEDGRASFEVYDDTCNKMDDIFRAIRNAIKKRK